MYYSKSTGGFYDHIINGNDIPGDVVEITPDNHRALILGQAAGKRITFNQNGLPVLIDNDPQTPEQTIALYEAALDAKLDSVARMYRYDNRFTFALRAAYAGPWHDEAVAFATWMDTCNAQAYALLQAVIAGEVEMPTIEDFLVGLPDFAYQ